ncbi:MAG: ribonuclease HI family protein [Candidatus Sungbacteria bacterium]|nr:ribonuclease HI family protein [Candidatus Sungbacteria bacterium]
MVKSKVQKERIVIYTDGGSRGNPGDAAIGVVIYSPDGAEYKRYGEAIGVATNNEAEYRAVVFGLQKTKALLGGAKAKLLHVEMRMDSELVARQLRGEYKIEEERLFPLFIKVWNLKIDFAAVGFVHVPREQNKEADKMVNQALDKQQQDLFSQK